MTANKYRDKEKSMGELLRAAGRGDEDAKYVLAVGYACQETRSGDDPWFMRSTYCCWEPLSSVYCEVERRLRSRGDKDAICDLIFLYAVGDVINGVAQDPAEEILDCMRDPARCLGAIDKLEEMTDKDDPNALYLLARMITFSERCFDHYFREWFVNPFDGYVDKANEYCLRAAEMGLYEAQAQIADGRLDGIRDQEIKWCKYLAEKGYPHFCYKMHFNEKNAGNAYLIAAAIGGDVRACNLLGDELLFRAVEEKDALRLANAIHWYDKASEKGDEDAMVALAKIYFPWESDLLDEWTQASLKSTYGKPLPVGFRDSGKAFQLLEFLLEHANAENMWWPRWDVLNMVRACYEKGIGTEISLAKADECSKKLEMLDTGACAARYGNDTISDDAMQEFWRYEYEMAQRHENCEENMERIAEDGNQSAMQWMIDHYSKSTELDGLLADFWSKKLEQGRAKSGNGEECC